MGGVLAHRLGLTASGGGGSPPPDGVKWRLEWVTPTGSGIYGASEIEMRLTTGGGDECTGGSAISSTEFSGSFLDDYAFDNNNATEWASQSNVRSMSERSPAQ